MGIGVAKFFVEEIIMRRVSFAKIDRTQLLLMVGFMGVLTLHGIHDRFGMRYLGSTVWGGRNYVSVYVGLIAFFVTQSVSVKSKVWNKLPYLVLAVTSFDLMIAIVTTVFPSSIYKIYPFYSAVSTAGVVELLTGQEDITGRIGSFGNFGCVLVAIVLATTSVRRLFSLQHLLRIRGGRARISLGPLFRVSILRCQSFCYFLCGRHSRSSLGVPRRPAAHRGTSIWSLSLEFLSRSAAETNAALAQFHPGRLGLRHGS